jgi:hypothetical protein
VIAPKEARATVRWALVKQLLDAGALKTVVQLSRREK